MQRRYEVKEIVRSRQTPWQGATQLEIVMGVSVCVITILCEDRADVTPLNVMRAGNAQENWMQKNFCNVR